MTFGRRFAVTLLLGFCTLHPSSPLLAATAKKLAPPYKGAVIMDAATGAVLFEDHQGEPSPPASMTKLMTFLVLHDKLASRALALETPVVITAADSRMGGTQVWLKEKEEFSVRELIYAMMIQSANDAAHALARTAAGSVPAFVELMNAKARELGMNNTTFRTPHGLPPANRKIADGDLTTPHDFALLARELLLKTDVLHYTSIKTREFGAGQRAQLVMMNNHNHLLGKIAGVDGLKTGFTNGAGFCLAATAERHGRRIIVVTMGSPDRKLRDIQVAELLERGFAALPADSKPFNAALDRPALQPVDAADSPISHAPVAEKNAPSSAPDGAPVIKFSVPPPKKK